ncbi:MAG TPA: extracellular solute-binding protein [Anaerolineae bacterium]|nr:extracellular solute-binding protein [Anaerolineae bacterium]
MLRWWKDADWCYRIGSMAGIALLAAAFVYGRLALARAEGPVRLQVYAFSTQEEVLTQEIFPAFEKAWEEETGRELTIEGVFGASGTLAGQINLGAPADVALLSNAHHVTYPRVGRRVRDDTEAVAVGETPMVIVVRPGNPKGIATYADLARPGVQVLHADPASSGAGQWAVLAEYGSALLETGDRAAAEAQLKAIWGNVHLLGASARSMMTLFELGAGDAFVTYEQDARRAQERGVPLEIVVPSPTIVAQHVALVVDDNVTLVERPAARAFVAYLQSEAAQQTLARYHLRPAGDGQEGFAPLGAAFTVEELGGWPAAYAGVIEKVWAAQIEPELDLEPISGPLRVEE